MNIASRLSDSYKNGMHSKIGAPNMITLPLNSLSFICEGIVRYSTIHIKKGIIMIAYVIRSVYTTCSWVSSMIP